MIISNGVAILSSGRKISMYCQPLFTLDNEGNLYSGSDNQHYFDGDVKDLDDRDYWPLSFEEREEIADYMIELWAKFGGITKTILGLDEMEAILLKRKKDFTSNSEHFGANPGLRLIRIHGQIVRAARIKRSLENLLDIIFDQLPLDASIIDDDGLLIRMLPTFVANSEFGYSNQYALVVASNEWPADEPGSMYKELEIKIPSLEEFNG